MTSPPIQPGQTSSAAIGTADRSGEGGAGRDGDGQRRSEKSPQAFRTISEVAQDLDVPPHVLRFWETRFSQVRPLKRGGGRRYYRPEDVDLLRRIRSLLYQEGYTIKGVQRVLREGGGLVGAQAAGNAAAQRGAAIAGGTSGETGGQESIDFIEDAAQGQVTGQLESGSASPANMPIPIARTKEPIPREAQGQAEAGQSAADRIGDGPSVGGRPAPGMEGISQGEVLPGGQTRLQGDGTGPDAGRLREGETGARDGRRDAGSDDSNGSGANGQEAATAGQVPAAAAAVAAEWRERLGKVLVDLRTVQAVLRQERGST